MKSLHFIPRPLALLFCLLSLLQSAQARDLRVGTKPTEPFVMRAPNQEWGGISIELWERVAVDQGWSFEYRELAMDELLSQTEAGSIDVAVAAFTVTLERERSLDFSYAFYSTGLGVAVGDIGGGWNQALSRFVSLRFLGIVAFLALLLFFVGSLVWLLERRRNAAQFGGTALQGIGSGFWWSAVTMTTVGYGDKAPLTWSGRLVALVWMFTAIIIISSITAALTSSLTMSQLGSRLAGPQDLAHARVGTVQGTAAQTLLRDRGISSEGFPTVTAGLQALHEGHLEAFVYDEPILRYWVLNGFQGTIEVLPWIFERQDYALVLPQGSPLRESINRSLLELLREPEWNEVLRRHIGTP